MSTVQRIAKNAAVLYAAHIITALLTLLLVIFIARELGDITFGKYSFALAFTAIFAIFLDLGFPTLIVRDVARDKSLASKYLGNIAVIKVCLSIVVFGLIALIINLMHYPKDTTAAVLIFGVYIMFVSFAGMFRVIFRAFERMEYEALVMILRQLVIVALGLAALFLGYGLIEIACVFLIGGAVDLMLSFLICSRKFARPKFEMALDSLKHTIRVALPLSVVPIAAIIYVRIDMVMLSAMKGDAVVGWYAAAYNLVLALKPLSQVFLSALFPVMAGLFISSISSLRFAYEKSLRYLFILGLPLATGTMLLSDRIILLFYGDQFTHSITVLQILAWDILLFFLCGCLGVVLISIDKQNRMAAAAVGCALLNVVLNLLLIPRFSYSGAAIATIATESVLLGLYFYFVSRYLYRLPLHKVVVKPLIACLAMALFVYFCGGINLAALIISAALLYFAVLYLIKGFTREDRELIGKIVFFRGDSS